jgi:hypothetical protein
MIILTFLLDALIEKEKNQSQRRCLKSVLNSIGSMKEVIKDSFPFISRTLNQDFLFFFALMERDVSKIEIKIFQVNQSI